MDRLPKSLSLNQNSSRKDSKAKQENMIFQRNVKSLQDWKLPPSSASDVFKPKGIFCCFSPDRTVKTVEREIRLSEGLSSVPLITENPQPRKLLYMGMIQVALKPTELGSDSSAVICLRDKRLLKFNESVLGMVESSLCDGPIYFSYFPRYCVSMTDPHLKSTFVIDVKTQGCEAILMYRFHYKVMEFGARDPKRTRSPVDEADGTTTLFVTEVARNNSLVSKIIYWDRVTVPEVWKVRSDSPSSSSAGGGEVAVGNAPVDWKEAAEAHVLKVDVPGLKKEEIRVEVEAGGILQISGERRKEELEEDEKWRCAERSSGKFVRRLKLPENAELEEVKAAVENGVLTVTVPKMEVGKKPLVKVIDISG